MEDGLFILLDFVLMNINMRFSYRKGGDLQCGHHQGSSRRTF